MASTLHESAAYGPKNHDGQNYGPKNHDRKKSFAQVMSDHVAYALVAYTLMLIFVVTPSVETKGLSIFPYFLLVLLVGGIIPVFRWFEKRWPAEGETAGVAAATENGGISDGRIRRRFATDRVLLWIIALAIPFLLALVCRTVMALF